MKKLLVIAAFCALVGGCGSNWGKDNNRYRVTNIEPDTSWFITGDEFTINTAEELAGLAVLVGNGREMKGITFRLGADISFISKTRSDSLRYYWKAIGSDKRPFKGTFDGNGYTVSGIYVNTITDHQGFFGWIEDAEIRNLGVLGLDVEGWNQVGGLVGTSRKSQIRNCYTSGKVKSGNNYAGGLAGYNDGGKIYDSYSKSSVSGNTCVGGFVGMNPGDPTTIVNCYSTGAVSGKSKTGGFAGGNDARGIIVNCYYDRETSGQDDSGKGEGQTASQMKQQATYLDWNFTDIWGIDGNINGGYPYLRMERQ